MRSSRLVSPTQIASANSQLGDGRVVVVYESKTGIFARIAFADGKLSQEIVVESERASCASVAMWNDGSFVIVYLGEFEGLRGGVFSQVFHADGSIRTPRRQHAKRRFRAGKNVIYRSEMFGPTVATSQQLHKYVVAWSSGKLLYTPAARWRRSTVSFCVEDALQSGFPPPVTESQPPTSSRSSEFNAAVQMVEMFPSLLAWANQQEEWYAGSFAQHQVHSQVHMPNGTDQQQTPFLGDAPTIACLGPTGAPPDQVGDVSIGHVSYVIAARSDLNPPNDRIKSAILYAVVDVGVAAPTNGPAYISSTKLLPVGMANEAQRSLPASSNLPAVTGLGGPHVDKFVICWNDLFNISARVFDRQGVPLSDETVLVESNGVDTFAMAPCVAALPDGSFYVAWVHAEQIANVAHQTIHGRRFELR